MTVPIVYEPRTYRDFGSHDRFVSFRVVIETSDLYVKAHSLLERETKALILKARSQVEAAIARRPEFLTSLLPVGEDSQDSPLVLSMIRAGKKANTGPMAAVAGAIAEFVGRELIGMSPEVIVENGGDIFLHVDSPVTVGLYAGSSPFSGRIGLRLDATPIPVGICTSSAKVGPSLSLGKADAATVVSPDTSLADAVATAMGNRVQKASDIKASVEWAMSIPGITGALAILGDKIAAVGDLELVSIPL
ncbi:UPF0280 family protein [Desulfomonile tiedjei]|uniref:Uncharacterized protein n=1 Tax=Desulfomonile tiedjei (strain ATCC 49306 / DSM 6799 / DCB-1) TaxID=706587 RepID=I4C6L5_DESTA|nr:UPF0280 family protein [Desulfomonile tiedjei]AFM25206.1 hypothetical protein Desti_2526 [Desulfomonile tiedjei DSM 6799]